MQISVAKYEESCIVYQNCTERPTMKIFWILFVLGLALVWNELRKTKKVRRELCLAQWEAACGQILLLKLKHENYGEESCLELLELWEMEGELAEEFERLGGAPHQVDFWVVHGDKYLSYAK